MKVACRKTTQVGPDVVAQCTCYDSDPDAGLIAAGVVHSKVYVVCSKFYNARRTFHHSECSHSNTSACVAECHTLLKEDQGHAVTSTLFCVPLLHFCTLAQNLLSAAEKGDLTGVEILLTAGVDVDCRDWVSHCCSMYQCAVTHVIVLPLPLPSTGQSACLDTLSSVTPSCGWGNPGFKIL